MEDLHARDHVPTCSVIVAAYNAAETIAETLDSVLGQTCQDLEVIVVDDGSTDDTAARVHDYLADTRVRLHRQQNSGPAHARNTGIALTSGRYVCVLDSDDMWLPCYLERMTGVLDAAPAGGFAFTRAWVLERSTNRIRKTVTPRHLPPRLPRDPASLMPILVKSNIAFSSVTVRREVLGDVGAYDPALSHAEDYDLSLRIVGAGYEAIHVPGPLAIVSDSPNSHSKDGRRMLLGVRDAQRKLIESQVLTEDVAALARRRVREAERELELLDGDRARSPRRVVRDALARSTLGWRRRRGRMAAPPPEVAAAFPGVGCGSGAEQRATSRVGLPA
jgi:glycosyltransferase involved in cell wall biosynthesis